MLVNTVNLSRHEKRKRELALTGCPPDGSTEEDVIKLAIHHHLEWVWSQKEAFDWGGIEKTKFQRYEVSLLI